MNVVDQVGLHMCTDQRREKADPNGVNPRGKARDNVSIADMKDIALLMVVNKMLT